jgi:sugar phosphate isomerase/epimerase
VFVVACTDCYRELDLVAAIEKLADLEYSAVEVAIHERGGHLRPSEVTEDPEKSLAYCRDTHRLDLAAFSIQIEATGAEHYRQFEACCKLAKAAKVVSLTVPSAELGTPFNEEVEHLRELVRIGTLEGVLISIKNEVGRLSQDPDTISVLCDNVKGLGVTFDPTTFVCGPYAARGYENMLKYVYHVHLRDSRKGSYQVRVGQGEIEYSKLISQLRRANYRRALSVNMQPLPGIEHDSEMRKMRLLLESLL